jgi:hypothetical protein
MKKVSEVQKEIDLLGCDAGNRKLITDLLVACGVLERDTEERFKVGDIWSHKDFGKIKITKQDGDNHWEFIYENGHKDGCGIEHFKENCTKLLWRDPE